MGQTLLPGQFLEGTHRSLHLQYCYDGFIRDDMEMIDMATLKTWKKYVEEGKCLLFENWHAVTDVSKEDFLKGLEWLFEDPMNAKTTVHKPMTRELVCTMNGEIKHFGRIYDEDGEFYGFCEEGKQRIGLPQRCTSMNVAEQLLACTPAEKEEMMEKAKEFREKAKKWGLVYGKDD